MKRSLTCTDLVGLNETPDEDENISRRRPRREIPSNKRGRFEQRAGPVSYPPIYSGGHHDGIFSITQAYNDIGLYKSHTKDINTHFSKCISGESWSIKLKNQGPSLLSIDLNRSSVIISPESKHKSIRHLPPHLDLNDTSIQLEKPATAALEFLQDSKDDRSNSDYAINECLGDENDEASLDYRIHEPPITSHRSAYDISPMLSYPLTLSPIPGIPRVSPDDKISTSPKTVLSRCNKPKSSTQRPSVSQLTRQLSRVCST